MNVVTLGDIVVEIGTSNVVETNSRHGYHIVLLKQYWFQTKLGTTIVVGSININLI